MKKTAREVVARCLVLSDPMPDPARHQRYLESLNDAALLARWTQLEREYEEDLNPGRDRELVLRFEPDSNRPADAESSRFCAVVGGALARPSAAGLAGLAAANGEPGD